MLCGAVEGKLRQMQHNIGKGGLPIETKSLKTKTLETKFFKANTCCTNSFMTKEIQSPLGPSVLDKVLQDEEFLDKVLRKNFQSPLEQLKKFEKFLRESVSDNFL